MKALKDKKFWIMMAIWLAFAIIVWLGYKKYLGDLI